jgi:spermidine synthase
MMIFVGVLLFFLVSGACGLLYQVVWTRKLVLLFGSTSYAVSTVLGIFFAGLGIGSLIGGRLADKQSRPLWIYGVLEIAIGIWALVFILLIGVGESAVVWMLSGIEESRTVGVILRALMATVYLIVPVTLMGATLPLLAKYVTAEMGTRGQRIGLLYALNTFGAVLGATLAGFFLIPVVGYTAATIIGAVANGAVGVLALIVSRSTETKTTLAPDDAATAAVGEGSSRFAYVLTVAAFAVSGFCAIALEVLWTRLLVLVFSGTTYAYTAMLTTMLCGIAIGSAVMAPYADRQKAPVGLFGLVLALNGAACVVMIAFFVDMPERYLEASRDSGFEWAPLVWHKFSLSFQALILPTLLFGMGFPLAVRAATAGRDALGRDVGRLYSANTFAGVFGAVMGGYVIIPSLGTHDGILVLSAVLAAAGLALVVLCPKSPLKTKGIFAGVAVLGCAVAYGLTPQDVSRALNESYIPESDTLIHYTEGVEGTVAVSEPIDDSAEEGRTLYINRVQATATIEKGLKMNRLQGVLPMMFDHDPEEALFMCMGSGSTLGALGRWETIKHIDAVEISPDVIAAAEYFKEDNLDVLNNDRLTFHVDDGRNFLLRSEKDYSIITFEPMPLALAGVSTFYTQEYYELCLDRLTPGGIVSQWVPLHSLNDEVVKSLIKTFTSTFPYYCAWFVNADIFLIGSNEPLSIDYALLEERLAQTTIVDILEPVGLADPIELVNLFVMGKEKIDEFAAGGRIMKDDRPWAEFLAPKIMYDAKVDEALAVLDRYIEAPGELIDFSGLSPAAAEAAQAAIDRRHESRRRGFTGLIAYRKSGMLGTSEEDFLAALDIDGNNRYAQYYLKDIALKKAEVHLKWGEEYFDRTIVTLNQAIGYIPADRELHLALGDVHHAADHQALATEAYQRHLDLGGDATRAAERIAQATRAAAQPN